MPKRIKVEDRFICSFCNRLFSSEEEAEKHEKGHDLVYVPFERATLKRLILAFKTWNPDYLTEDVWNTLRQFDRL